MLSRAGGGRQNDNADRPAVKKMGFSEWAHILNPAIDGGYVLRSYPDKPSHPKQRYYLSEKGLKLVK